LAEEAKAYFFQWKTKMKLKMEKIIKANNNTPSNTEGGIEK